ncbi:DegT/DnrJ/EryC1/StrS family aminotransferase [Photorhabdus bodei]|uniref:DegT/DnrJ/EryC1/StrS family aminotransferase n=1 Tax=Photorhabdus bodei TaxID=2029681 RepID=A0AAW6BIM2_9GAMM|nr:DegT/DnrJ/EryC1/StrS family aminotransferase [Photorhabdus bodei]MDB6372558.1 DegT/DnrJ/EryC1/StrS family aminotransferase [Photorhabdus bodei]
MKLAIIGCGNIVLKEHIPTINILGIEIVGLCDILEENIIEARKLINYKIPSYSCYQEMLEEVPTDSVLVALPHYMEVHTDNLKEFAITGTGLNLRMHPLGAAVVLPQMDKFHQMMEEKRETARILKHEIEKINGLKITRIPKKADPAWYAMPIMFDKSKFTVGLHEFVDALTKAGAVEADIPGSTCPIHNYSLFHSPERISKNYEKKDRVLPENFKNAIKFHNSMFKLDIWYGPERQYFIDNYLAIITSTTERLRK